MAKELKLVLNVSRPCKKLKEPLEKEKEKEKTRFKQAGFKLLLSLRYASNHKEECIFIQVLFSGTSGAEIFSTTPSF